MTGASEAALGALRPRVGTEIGLSDWTCVDQPMIDAFAAVTGDRQWIHVDPDRAAGTAFGGTIAHGFLTLSLASRFVQGAVPAPEGLVMGVNYGFDRVRFLSPVRAACRLRGRFTLDAIVRRDAVTLQRTLGVVMEIDGEERPALQETWLGLSVFRD